MFASARKLDFGLPLPTAVDLTPHYGFYESSKQEANICFLVESDDSNASGEVQS